MDKQNIVMQGSIIANKLLENKKFKADFEVLKKLLWESPFSDTCCKYLYDNKETLLVIDLYAVSYGIYIDGDSIYTNNSLFQKSDTYKKFQSIQPMTFSEILKAEWKPMLQRYIDNILRFYRSEQIILIRSEKSGYETTPYQCNVTRNLYLDFNKNLLEVENYFVEKTNCFVIDLCKYYFGQLKSETVNPNMDYEEEFFDNLVIALKSILNGDMQERNYSIPEYCFILKRYAKYYNHMLRTNLQVKLLDDSDFVDHIVLCLGGVQLQKYIEVLNDIKHKQFKTYDELFINYDFSEFYNLRQAIRCIEAIDKGNFTIPKFDYSIIFAEDMRLKTLMIPKVRQRLIQEKILGDVDVTIHNIELCFTYLNLFLSKQYRKAMEYILQNAERLIKPIDVDIWGSCISREIYNLNSGKIKLSKYLYRACCLHAFQDRVIEDASIFENIELFTGTWRRDVIETELSRKAPEILQASKANWIIIDFFDIVERCYKYNGQEFVLDSFGVNSPFFKSISKEVSAHIWYEQPDALIKERMDVFIYFLKRRYGNCIILNRHLRSRYKITLDNQIVPFKNVDLKTLNMQNSFIRKWEQYFIDASCCYYIDIAKNFLGDECFVWGASQVHYENIFYSESIKLIEEIILNKPIQKYYTHYSYSTRINRILRLLPLNRNSAILQDVFSDYYLDKILLQMDYQVIEKYKDVIEHIYEKEYCHVIEMLNGFDFEHYNSSDLKKYIIDTCNLRLSGDGL